MPVVGLPTAVEVMLTSLLTSEELSSWKVAGEHEDIVVVLRFRPSDGQPSQASGDHRRGYWRRKPPSQLRRDQRRAQQYRENDRGEQAFRPFVENVADSASNIHFEISSDAAQGSRASTSLCPQPPTTLTFAPTSDAAVTVDNNKSEPEKSVSVDVRTDLLPPEAVCGAADKSSSDDSEWWRNFMARMDAMLSRSTGSEERNTSNEDSLGISKPVEDRDGKLKIRDGTSSKPPFTDVNPAQLPHPTHQTPDPPAAKTPSTIAAPQTNQQLAARHNKPGDLSGDTERTWTRSRSSAKQKQGQQLAKTQ